MLYNQPYGKPAEVTWGDTPYINGNPATGSPGSIPPAASIEYPQREIVNLIRASPLTPSNSDLMQLARALQSGAIWFGVDQGTANAYQVTLNPPPLALYPGMCVLVKIAHDNTGPSVLNVNALGSHPIQHHDHTDIAGSELLTNALELFCYDGIGTWELAWSQRSQGGGGPIYLSTNKDYYIDNASGNDSYDGLSATYTTGIHGPFKTLQKAADQIPLYNLNGYSVTMHVAGATYAPFTARRINGVGNVFWIGNPGTPGNVWIQATNKSAIGLSDIGGTYYFDGFRVSCTGSLAGDGICSINAYGPTSIVVLGAIEFHNAGGAHISTQNGSMVSNYTPGCNWTILGSAAGSAYENGSFVFAYAGGKLVNNSGGGPALSVPSGVGLAGSFIECNFNSFVQLVFQSISAATVSGKKFNTDQNSEISTGGQSVNYYPGTVAGTQGAHGGYYS
jgi:hypothetical protein